MSNEQNIYRYLSRCCSLALGWLASPNNALKVISMCRPLGPQFFPQLRAVQHNLLARPALEQSSHEGNMTLNVGQNAHCGEPANLLQSLVLRPVSNGDLDRLGLDIYEASGLEALLLQIVRKRCKDTAELATTFVEELAPLSNCATILQTPVVAAAHGVSFVALDPASGLGHLKRALVQGVPVRDAAVEEAHVHKIGRVRRERPVESKILDLELDVWGNPARDR